MPDNTKTFTHCPQNQERQESRCSLIFDSCIFAWQTGQLTISTPGEEEGEEATWCIPAEDCSEGEEDEEVVAVFCCIAGDFVFIESLDAADLLPNVFWKKSKIAAEFLLSSNGLFLDAGLPPAAPDILSLLEPLKYLDCRGLASVPVGTTDGYLEWLALLGLDSDVLGKEVRCLEKREEEEEALLDGDATSLLS